MSRANEMTVTLCMASNRKENGRYYGLLMTIVTTSIKEASVRTGPPLRNVQEMATLATVEVL